MFTSENPIISQVDDKLGRLRFSTHLGKAILDWKEQDSLIVGLYGKWWSWKTSVVNLAKEEILKNKDSNKPTIIEFNPWAFSNSDNLTWYFFWELSKQLLIENPSKEDQKLAQRLEIYASLLSLIPSSEKIIWLSSKIFIGLWLMWISVSGIINLFDLDTELLRNLTFWVGFIVLAFWILKDYIVELSSFFKQRSLLQSKSIIEIKSDIQKLLIARQKKLIVIIDDIDRLSKSEINDILKLVRINADFPNTIYLLAFDREIIEKNLDSIPDWISWREYLEKIIQVGFDLPLVNQWKIETYLFSELDKILDSLPPKYEELFDKERWANLYHSGFKYFFRNIRDVKRFANSLKFNISQLSQWELMEVNPIDFIWIEAIRLFTPSFYSFLRWWKGIFTQTESYYGSGSRYNKKDESQALIDAELKKLDETLSKAIKGIIEVLFPQTWTSSYWSEWQAIWSRKLFVCSERYYNAYFTFIPWWDESEISNNEINTIIGSFDALESSEELLDRYIQNGKIKKILSILQDYTWDESIIPKDKIKNVILALFNISDKLPNTEEGFFSFWWMHMEVMRISFQLLKREKDLQANFEILKEVIKESKTTYASVRYISMEDRKWKKEGWELTIAADNIEELEQLCVERLENSFESENVIEHEQLLEILYRWKEFDKKEKWKAYLYPKLDSDKIFLNFISKFVRVVKSQTLGSYYVKDTKEYNYKSLQDFIDITWAKDRIALIKQNDQGLYLANQEIIDLFIDNFDKPSRHDAD